MKKLLLSAAVSIISMAPLAAADTLEWTASSFGRSNSVIAIAYDQPDGAQNIKFLDTQAIHLCGDYYDSGASHAYRNYFFDTKLKIELGEGNQFVTCLSSSVAIIDFGDRYDSSDRVTEILEKFVKWNHVELVVGSKVVTFSADGFVARTDYTTGW